MSMIRFSKVIRELNISIERAISFLNEKGVKEEIKITSKISQDIYEMLLAEFSSDKKVLKDAEKIVIAPPKPIETPAKEETPKKVKISTPEKVSVKPVERIDLKTISTLKSTTSSKKEEEVKQKEDTSDKSIKTAKKQAPKKEKIQREVRIDQPKILDKKDLSTPVKKTTKSEVEDSPSVVIETEATPKEKKKPAPKEKIEHKTQLSQPKVQQNIAAELEKEKKRKENIAKENARLKEERKAERKKEKLGKEEARKDKRKQENAKKATKVNVEGFIEKQGSTFTNEPAEPSRKFNNTRSGSTRTRGKRNEGPRRTLAPSSPQNTVQGAKHRRAKRNLRKEREEEIIKQEEAQSKTLEINPFTTVSELATLMDVGVGDIISACMNVGMMVGINQTLDTEVIDLVADHFGYEIQFLENIEEEEEEEDAPEDLVPRSPVVAVMGHVDHGKTSLLDHIRKTNVTEGEAGGITQHINAYSVRVNDQGQHITFLDTPGHQAFTSMRMRGTQMIDLAIIIIAADDGVMTQTEEAIAHVQAANLPIVFALNKMDKAGANPEKIREQLGAKNIMLDSWGGTFFSQEISAKTGDGIQELLEKVLLEAEELDLKANPNRKASGIVIESEMKKGQGYVSSLLIQNGTLKVGDYVLSGSVHGKIKSMTDDKGKRVKKATPSDAINVQGLNSATQAGDKFRVYTDEKEAKRVASRRDRYQQEQTVRVQSKIHLDEFSRRLEHGDFKELKFVLRSDTDGTLGTIADSLEQLTTEQIKVSIVHRGVGQITETDVMLASASDVIILGFNVKPTAQATRLSEKEGVEIRTYSIIYDLLENVKDALEGAIKPEYKEERKCVLEIREIFNIPKVGKIAGCRVIKGKVTSDTLVRVIRQGSVIHDGKLNSLKRFESDVKEVQKDQDCGLTIASFNGMEKGDVIEGYSQIRI